MKSYSNDYFRSKIKAHRLTVSRSPNYKTIDELLKRRNIKTTNRKQGREK